MPWRPAAATSIGSLPGSSPLEAARIVAGELPDFLHVAELPARGPGADMVGRTGGLLSSVSVGLGLETTPDGWRFARASGREMRRAISLLGEDLDALEQSAVGYAGPVKCQLVGPWTLAAAIELPTGERALRDPAAVWDIAQALSEAIREHVADVRRRLPMASAVVVQLDEPSLPAVLAGRIGTASGLSSYRAVDVQDAERVLGHVLQGATAAGAFPGVHCCSDDIPIDLLRVAGASFVSMDITALTRSSRHDEGLGQAWDEGLGILAGTVPAVGDAADQRALGEARASAPLRAILHRLGLEDDEWLAQVAVTPSCGLAGASPQWARAALAACRTAGRISRDDDAERAESGDER